MSLSDQSATVITAVKYFGNGDIFIDTHMYRSERRPLRDGEELCRTTLEHTVGIVYRKYETGRRRYMQILNHLTHISYASSKLAGMSCRDHLRTYLHCLTRECATGFQFLSLPLSHPCICTHEITAFHMSSRTVGSAKARAVGNAGEYVHVHVPPMIYPS